MGVLETFTPTRTAHTATEVARRADLPTSTAHRIVSNLVTNGSLEHDDDRRVRIGVRLWELATRGSRPMHLRQPCDPECAPSRPQTPRPLPAALLPR